MNKIYTNVWSVARGAYVVASELAKSPRKGTCKTVSNHQPPATNHPFDLKRTALAIGVSLFFAPAAFAVGVTDWATWTLPSAYPLATAPNYLGGDPNYQNSFYAVGAVGSVLNPQGGTVNLTLSGEVNSNSPNASPSWGSVWQSNVNTAYVTATSPNSPVGSTALVQTGYTTAQYKAHTLTFSQSVTNAVMALGSLGSPARVSTLTFSQPFVILSGNGNAYFSSGGNATTGYTLTGYEGSGVIQFLGTYSSISWSVSAPEYFGFYNFALTTTSNASANDPTITPYVFPGGTLPPAFLSTPDIVSGNNGQAGYNSLSTLASGNYKLRFDGGTLVVDSGTPATTNANFTIVSGANKAFIDQNGNYAVFAGTFSDDTTNGRLIIQNGNGTATAGKIALTNTGNSYSGGTEVRAGATLSIADPRVLGSGGLDLVGSATAPATLETTSTMTINAPITVAGDSVFNVTPNTTLTIGSPIAGNGGSLSITGGSFAQNAVLSNMSAVNIGSGTFFASAADIGSNNVNNAGVLAVADGKTTTISGNYIQSATGVFETMLSGATSYGKLAVNGNVDISASNSISVNVIGAPSLVAGTVLPSVISATGTMTAGPTFNVTDNSALFNFIGVKNGNTVELRILSSNVTALGSVNTTHATPATGAASVIDTLIAAGAAAPAGMADVITALGMLPTQQAVSDAVAQTVPLLTAGMGQVTSGTTHSTNRIVQARMDMNRGLSTGDEFVGNKYVWLKPFYSQADQGMVNGVAGFRSTSSGFVLGADGEAGQHDRIGVALSYSTSTVRGKALTPNSGTVKSTQLVAYGSHALNQHSEISYQADIGTHRNDGARQISFGGLNRVASGTYNSTSFHAGVGYGQTILAGEDATIAPTIRLDYSSMRDNGYTETGAGGLNLIVQGHTTNSLVLSADGRAVKKLNERSTLSGNLGVGYDALSKQSSLTSSFVGGGAAFTTTGIKPSPVTLSGGVGLSYTADNGSEVLLRYDLEARDRFTNQTGSVKWRMPL